MEELPPHVRRTIELAGTSDEEVARIWRRCYPHLRWPSDAINPRQEIVQAEFPQTLPTTPSA